MPTPLQSPTPSLVLASASTIRLSLLHAAGLSVTARPSALDETPIKRQTPDDATAAIALAEAKAATCDDDAHALILGADQILTCDGRRFDKPADRAAAAAQLRILRGRTHTLHTALVCRLGGRTIWRHLSQPTLAMRPISDTFLAAYLDLEADRLLASVGAYRLEGPGLHLFDRIDGEHTAILGLPLLPLLGFLRSRHILLD
jgi:septum formation protein